MKNLKNISETSHTRYPLCMEDKDHVIGLVHIKDLMEQKEKARKDLRLVRRDILTVPEVMKLSVLLQYMRTRRIYQAVVVDEYGGMVGLVCLEDIIEELVGDIKDEHETDLPAVVINDDGTFDFDGKVLVDEVEYAMHVDFDEPEEDTIGGYIFGMLERTPVVGDTVELPVMFSPLQKCKGIALPVSKRHRYHRLKKRLKLSLRSRIRKRSNTL